MRIMVLLLIFFPFLCQAQPDTLFREGFEQPCQFLPSPLSGQAPTPYTSYAGVPFGTNHTWAWGNASNTYNAGNLDVIGVKSYAFLAPSADQTRRINFPSSTGGIAVSISNQCGNFNVYRACRGFASSAIVWTTKDDPLANQCPLSSGTLYYLNYSWFNYPAYLQNGSVSPTCECPGVNCVCSGSSCIATCQYGNNSTP